MRRLLVSTCAVVALLALSTHGARLTAGDKEAPASVLVKLPPGAELATVHFGDYLTKSTGLQRWYVTPPLTPGKSYSYQVTAAWTVDGKESKLTQKVSVTAGKESTADFTEPGVGKKDTKKGKAWVELFDGKSLAGWKSHPDSPGKWEVKDGMIVGSGKAVSHLFSERGDYENFHFFIEAKVSDKGNSGQYFRAQFKKGYPPGYEAQINSTHTDKIRTGSLYPSFNKELSKEDRAKITVLDQLHKPDEWFTQEVIAEGNHIQIFVNRKKTVDFVDTNNSFTKGHFAIQQHSSFKDKTTGDEIESIIYVRKAEVKELPPTK
jgi:uncharacterized protein (TIGR03000 family)